MKRMGWIRWNRWYSLKSYFRSALWIVPLVALVVELVLKRVAEALGSWMVRRGFYDLKTGFFALAREDAQAMVERIFTLNLSFLVFTFGSLLVAIQVAGGQYTPRIIATALLRDNVIRYVSGVFVFVLLWANRTLIQLSSGQVPQLQVFLTLLFGLASLVAFLLLIDYAARMLRPVNLVSRIAEQGITVIQDVYGGAAPYAGGVPAPATKKRWWFLSQPALVTRLATVTERLGSPARIVRHSGTPGVVLAVNVELLMAEAGRADSVIEFVPQVGDFVAADEPLFHLYRNVAAVDDNRMSECVALGTERTIEQDPMFAFRILVDIALKALSPAINDPTTAVLAIDQLQRLLRLVGMRSLRNEEFVDSGGRLRVIFRTPNWENYVHVACREIRQYGAHSMQVARRLRAMIENLVQSLPEPRHAALQEELRLLDRAVEKACAFREDLALARIPDSQGLGGASSSAIKG